MEKRKLDIEVFSAWNSYAISMMSVLENCGMWKETDSFQKFMSVTGIASQFCVDANCSALPITDYDWLDAHTHFMDSIGIQTRKYYASPTDELYSAKQEEAISEIKQAIKDGRASVVWGIDTGEFGVIYGYDDEDEVFFAKGIGSQNMNFSMPILYGNLGKTFEPAPILCCEIPESAHEVDWNVAYMKALELYVLGMQMFRDDSGRMYGLAVYDAISEAVNEGRVDSFGFKYCVGVFYERKDAMLKYLEEMQKEQNCDLQAQMIDSFRITVDLYRRLMFDVLREGTEGWNSLFEPVDREHYLEAIKIIQKLKASEERNVELAKRILQKKIL